MKKICCILLAFLLVFCCVGCSDSYNSSTENAEQKNTQTGIQNSESKILVIYFSCTGNTKSAAENIQNKTNGDIFEIVPSERYSADDLNYNDNNCRANREMNDENARPEIKNDVKNLDDYDTVFIGYPIWWGTCPRIINTLLDTYDFSGKTIIPFCTSGSSGISQSVSVIKENEPGAVVKDGLRIENESEIDTWLKSVLA